MNYSQNESWFMCVRLVLELDMSNAPANTLSELYGLFTILRNTDCTEFSWGIEQPVKAELGII